MVINFFAIIAYAVASLIAIEWSCCERSGCRWFAGTTCSSARWITIKCGLFNYRTEVGTRSAPSSKEKDSQVRKYHCKIINSLKQDLSDYLLFLSSLSDIPFSSFFAHLCSSAFTLLGNCDRFHCCDTEIITTGLYRFVIYLLIVMRMFSRCDRVDSK